MRIQNTGVEARHPWPEGCRVQGGGEGVVISRKGNYTTAFVEAFPGTFIRGEGETIEQAEDACWAQYQKRIGCPGHEWEARGYRNGAGFCKHCDTFESGVFTPEQLGCFCKKCGVATYWARVGDDFFCKDHAHDPDTEFLREARRRLVAQGKADTVTGTLLGDLFARLAEEKSDG